MAGEGEAVVLLACPELAASDVGAQAVADPGEGAEAAGHHPDLPDQS